MTSGRRRGRRRRLRRGRVSSRRRGAAAAEDAGTPEHQHQNEDRSGASGDLPRPRRRQKGCTSPRRDRHLAADPIVLQGRGFVGLRRLPRRFAKPVIWIVRSAHAGMVHADPRAALSLPSPVALPAKRDVCWVGAAVRDGDVVLDVGCGEGLIGFGALTRGASLVIVSNVSEDLLTFCCEAAAELGVSERCRFLRASADDLSALGDAEVDVVTHTLRLDLCRPQTSRAC
jgi:Methyltransferase domain